MRLGTLPSNENIARLLDAGLIERAGEQVVGLGKPHAVSGLLASEPRSFIKTCSRWIASAPSARHV